MIKTVGLLALCQALVLSSTSLVMTSSALVGLAIAPDSSLATLHLGICYTTVMVALIPVSLAMQKYGRINGFTLGALCGLAGGLLAGYGIYTGSFLVFCLAAIPQGIAMASGQFFRFAAAEVASEEYRSRAISWVLAGGLAAAFIGPSLATFTRDTLNLPPFSVSYSLIAILNLGILLCLVILNLPRIEQTAHTQPRRPLREIVVQPSFVAAVACAMIAYGIMNLLMTSTPLAMGERDLAFSQTATVIQWHIVGMFAPSFFTGSLIHRFGVFRVMLVGVLFLGICVIFSQGNQDFHAFLIALVCLGIGWNFLFVGGTTLLTEVYRPSEKGLIQGLNDFLVFFAVSCTALLSGYLHFHLGWSNLNLLVVPALGMAILSIFWAVLRRSSTASVT